MIFNFVDSFVYHITLLPGAFKESSVNLKIKIIVFELNGFDTNSIQRSAGTQASFIKSRIFRVHST